MDEKNIQKVIKENIVLKEKMSNLLNEKEELLAVCKALITEKEKLERQYNNLRSSKLGRLTIWYWKRRQRNARK